MAEAPPFKPGMLFSGILPSSGCGPTVVAGRSLNRYYRSLCPNSSATGVRDAIKVDRFPLCTRSVARP